MRRLDDNDEVVVGGGLGRGWSTGADGGRAAQRQAHAGGRAGAATALSGGRAVSGDAVGVAVGRREEKE